MVHLIQARWQSSKPLHFVWCLWHYSWCCLSIWFQSQAKMPTRSRRRQDTVIRNVSKVKYIFPLQDILTNTLMIASLYAMMTSSRWWGKFSLTTSRTFEFPASSSILTWSGLKCTLESNPLTSLFVKIEPPMLWITALPKYWAKRTVEIPSGVYLGFSLRTSWTVRRGIWAAKPHPRPWSTWTPIQWPDVVVKAVKVVYSPVAMQRSVDPAKNQGL